MDRSLGQQMCRNAGIFQGITAFPAMLTMGNTALQELYYPHSSIYRFITAVSTGLMSAGIIFIVCVQRHPKNTKTSTYYFEIVKSGLATALWLWLFLDSIFGPPHSSYYPIQRVKAIVEASLCFLVLPIVFLPTLAFSIYDKKNGDERVVDEERGGDEREPLLRLET